MASPLKEGTARLVSWALALPAFLLPISNPDLFWHLSSARWMLEHRCFPREEFLSFTMAGQPWSNFEWLSQLIFYGAYAAGGLPALWALKAGLLVLAARLFLKTMDLYRLPELYRAAALVLWSLAALAGSDIRPELFSLLLFSALILALEAHRLGRLALSPAAFFAVFALWANLHAGFIFGLLLIACFAAAAAAQAGAWRKQAFCGAAAALGALCSPYGWGPYLVSLRHWRESSGVSAVIQEWQPITFGNAFHWPFWLVLALFAAAFAAGRSRLWSRRAELAPAGLFLAGLFLGVYSLLHARLAVYFCAVALPFIFFPLAEASVTLWRRRAAAGAAVAVLALLIWTLPALSWSGPFDYKHVVPRAASFLSASRGRVESLRLYHEWEWGGYLAWRLPWMKVFWDGRYVFHGLLEQAGAASRQGPQAWQEWLEGRGLQGALVRNRPDMFPTTKLYKEGTNKTFLRPWYLQYFPRQNWALVYWDAQALFFLRRDAVAPDWLAAQEYRYFRPGDEAALEEALRTGEVSAEALAAEKDRHAAVFSGF